jgi:Ca-activated chloride channel family protein
MSLFELHNPWVLLLLLPAFGLFFWSLRRNRAPAVTFPTVARVRGLRLTWRQRLRFVVPLLQAVALVGLIIAGARPREGDARTVVRRQGIAIQMVLDRSGSMENKMLYQNRERKRIDIVRDVFIDFVTGGKDLAGRKTDVIGLTTFARFAEESCPLVSLHEPLVTTVTNLTAVQPFLDQYRQPTSDRAKAKIENPLNATAIGDGLYNAVLSLVTAEEDLSRGEDEGGYKIQGKVVILLTDGENNTGMDPVEAGAYAAANDVRVYYIVFREAVEYSQTIFGRQVRRELSVDDILADPRKVIEPTGGQAFLARSGDELRQIYEEIDQMEKSEIGRIEFRSYHERYHLFLIPAVLCALLAVILGETWLRSIP